MPPYIPMERVKALLAVCCIFLKIRHILSLGVFVEVLSVASIVICQRQAALVVAAARRTMTEGQQDQDYASGVAAFEAKNFSLAMQLLSPVADAGNADAQHRVAIMCQNGLGVVRNELRAFKMMKAAAEQGYAIAQHGIGFMYLEGECVEQSSEKAAEWFRKAGEQGLAGSLTTLAQMYETGNGVEKDPDEAKRLYSEAGFDF